jgi:V-type H+-transporting ATPase subunit d
MSRILAFEADRRSINITLNSFNTDLSKERRAKLFPTIGRLYPEGNNVLARADELDQVKLACDGVADYKNFFDPAAANGGGGGGSDEHSSLEDKFFRYDVDLNKKTFLQQFQYGVFYSFVKLKEQEIRSLTWIAESVVKPRSLASCLLVLTSLPGIRSLPSLVQVYRARRQVSLEPVIAHQTCRLLPC